MLDKQNYPNQNRYIQIKLCFKSKLSLRESILGFSDFGELFAGLVLGKFSSQGPGLAGSKFLWNVIQRKFGPVFFIILSNVSSR